MEDRISVVRTPLYGFGGTFAYTGTAGNSSALPLQCLGVWVYCTTDAYVRLGTGATATATDWPIPAFQMVWIPAPNNPTTAVRLSAIQVSGGGSAYFCPGQ